MKRLLLALLAFAPSAFAADAAKPLWKTIDAALEPGKVLEHCEKLPAGQKRRYSWKADGPVDFNIHYHQDNEVFYPVKRERMRGDGGTFTARSEQEYCWMWTARKGATRVEGRVETQ